VLGDEDPVFGTFVPEFYKDSTLKNEPQISSEIHKMTSSNLKQDEDQRFKFED
jgi:hypothetical protein